MIKEIIEAIKVLCVVFVGCIVLAFCDVLLHCKLEHAFLIGYITAIIAVQVEYRS